MAANPMAADPMAAVRGIVTRSKTSFIWGMRVLPAARRDAMFAVYAFCREVDDIADEPGEMAAREARLEAWRRDIDRLYEGGEPTHPVAHALKAPIADYGLPRAEFQAVIDGMEMDLHDSLVGPSETELALYCRRVAVAVGLLSVRVFGAEGREAEGVAEALGRGLQLTNVLRDLHEDAARGRLYLPHELLEAHGIETRDPVAVLAHPALPGVCGALAARARACFDETRTLLAGCDRRAMKPCVLMMEVYARILGRLERRGWHDVSTRVSLPAAEKLWIVLRYGLV